MFAYTNPPQMQKKTKEQMNKKETKSMIEFKPSLINNYNKLNL